MSLIGYLSKIIQGGDIPLQPRSQAMSFSLRTRLPPEEAALSLHYKKMSSKQDS